MTPSISRRSPSRRRAALACVLVGLALTAGVAGCSGSTRSASSGGGAVAPQPMKQEGAPAGAPANGAAAQDRAGAAPQAAQPGAAVAKPAQLPAIQRSIIYNGSMTVRVDDVNRAADQLVGLATGAGGFIGGDQRSIDAGKSTATLTLRIPADRFARTLDDISHLGHEQSRQVSTQDVTANVVDLDARIQAQQASVDRVRALLAKAQTIGEVTSVEGELSRREADLESLQGQKRSLDDLTALSTIAVTLLGPDAVPPKPKPAQGGFLGGLKSGWHAFASTVGVLLTVLGALLPFLLVLAVPALLVYRWLRRRARVGQPAAPGSARLSEATAVPKAGSEA